MYTMNATPPHTRALWKTKEDVSTRVPWNESCCHHLGSITAGIRGSSNSKAQKQTRAVPALCPIRHSMYKSSAHHGLAVVEVTGSVRRWQACRRRVQVRGLQGCSKGQNLQGWWQVSSIHVGQQGIIGT